jgi:omega-6 fatty acid desaturase (delta-12 desaturase)
MLTNKDLLIASRKFAHENRRRSWWHVCSTLAVALALAAIACSELHWGTRVLTSGLLGLVIVRIFVLYHDYQHGTILRRSWAGKVLMDVVGLAMLTPPSGWNRSHNHHHAHNSKLSAPDIGTYPLMTVDQYRNAGRAQKALYLVQRHPVTMGLGYLTVFLYGMCIRPFLANPRRHWDGALSVLCHGALLFWFGWNGMDDLVCAALLPSAFASAIGAYLFYAQHNYPGVQLQPASGWEYTNAALDSSSYIQMGPLMSWFTANIGYHHVHHLNPRIPFYRLPEAMRALSALQTPGTSSLGTADIRGCLRLKLWDPDTQRLVPLSHLRKAA